MIPRKEIIPTGVMAYNEEKVIGRCLQNLLLQRFREGFQHHVFVVANACTDRTVEIAKQFAVLHPNVTVLDIKEKGKSNAIRQFKACLSCFFEQEATGPPHIDKIVFMDADIRLGSSGAIQLMADALNADDGIKVITPHGIPDLSTGVSRYLTLLYEAKGALRESIRGTSLSGMCYMIRREIAEIIDIPDYMMADDRYIQERLRGGIFEDWGISYYYPIPPNFRSEVKRILRHSVANRQIQTFFKERMFHEPIIPGLKTYGIDSWKVGRFIGSWWGLPLKYKFPLLLFYLLGKIGDLRAEMLIRRHGAKNIKHMLTQWRTVR
jgi:glycosyltransferase involved in cell wall biosynthesis